MRLFRPLSLGAPAGLRSEGSASFSRGALPRQIAEIDHGRSPKSGPPTPSGFPSGQIGGIMGACPPSRAAGHRTIAKNAGKSITATSTPERSPSASHGAMSSMSERLENLIRRIFKLLAFARPRAAGIMLSSRAASAAINGA
jgi:hypothetical protein